MCVIIVVIAAFLLVCVDVMVMSSTYEVSCSGGGCGMYDVYILKSVGERVPP